MLASLWNSRLGVVSTQVLQEFFVNVVQKIQRPMDKRLAKDIVRDLLKWHVVVNNGDSILDAIDIHNRYGYAFWDAMIIEAAVKGGSAILMSEDLQDGQVISGVSIKNPFV
jgi:predicted nucleic acid-binding protein